MTATNGQEHRLPSRELSYNYTVAMYFAQQLELNLRAILYTADYHGWGGDLTLTEEQLKRFKDTDAFIDKATCGAVIEKLRSVGIIKDKKAMCSFERACAHRNRLAHKFLSDQNFDLMTRKQESRLLTALKRVAIDLFVALRISREARKAIEVLADKDFKKHQEILGEFLGSEYDEPNRKYGTRIRKNKPA